jgi:cell division protein FtsB
MKKRRFNLKYVIYGLVFCYVGYILVSQQFAINRVNGDVEKYSGQNKKIEESNSYLKDQIQFAQTDEFKEKIAREKIGLIMPGETMYIINEEN